jgi:hypothetical protein
MRNLTFGAMNRAATHFPTSLISYSGPLERDEVMRRALWILLIIVLIVAAAVILPGIANAQVNKQAASNVSCSGNGCNNRDPQTTGCAASAYTVQTAVLATIFLQLRYSRVCKTNWGRVITRSSNNNQVFLILITRSDGLSYGINSQVGPIAWSRMVYAPVLKAQACVSINGGNDLCTAFV